MNKLLSVIVPIYNVAAYLDRCLDSIVTQSYDNLEIILVDDGSTDDSGEICDRWQKKESRIKVIHKVNGGLADARNAGLDRAIGDYVAFVDGDDSICKDMYKSMINSMEYYDADISCCAKIKIYENGKKVVTQNCEKLTVFDTSEAIGNMLIGNKIDESACDKVFCRELFNDIRFPAGVINEDLPVITKLFSKSKCVIHTGEAFYNYFQNTGSITRSSYSGKNRIYIKHIKQTEQFIMNNHKELEGCLSMFVCRYCYSMMLRIFLQKNGAKEYASDLKWYKKRYKRTFHNYVKCKDLTFKDRMTALIMYLGLGRFLCLLILVNRKIRSRK